VNPGNVYFIRSGARGPVKIGYTRKDPSARLADLQTGSPVRLRLLGFMPGAPADERSLHRRFASLRLLGEWFHPSRELLDALGLKAERGRPGKPGPRKGSRKSALRQYSAAVFAGLCDAEEAEVEAALAAAGLELVRQ